MTTFSLRSTIDSGDFVLTAGGSAPEPIPEPVVVTKPKIIFDTDYTTDCDDVGALAMAHVLADRGEIDLLAVIRTGSSYYGPAAVSAVNRYYGRPIEDLPIGVYNNYYGTYRNTNGTWQQALATEYPVDVQSADECEDGVSLYRRILDAADLNSVVILVIGPMLTVRALLESQPDDVSPLPGSQLVSEKVSHFVVMGGDYPSGDEHNFRADGVGPSTRIAVHGLPRPSVYIGYTLGREVVAGAALQSVLPDSPQARAFLLHGSANGRYAWDQIALYYAARGRFYGSHELFHLVSGGYNEVASSGENAWLNQGDPGYSRDAEVGRQHVGYLTRAVVASEIAQVIDELMETPPQEAGVPPTTAPTLTASAVSQSQINLSWTSVDGATGYRYRVDGGSWIDVGSDTSAQVTGLSAGTEYTFDVRGYNSAGDGPIGTATESTLPAANNPPVFQTSPPTSVRAGQTYVYNGVVTDADGDPITITLEEGPDWLELTDHGDGTFTLEGTAPNE